MAFVFGTDVNPDGNLTRSLGSSSAKWKINGHIQELIEVTISETANTSVTVNNANITADHIVLNPYEVTINNFSYTTTSGSVTFTCPTGFPDCVFYLGVKA